jgi:hypothetical protein
VKKSKGRNYKYKKLGTARRKRNKQLLPALAAVGGACGLAATPAFAIELGDIKVDSHLGQPLRASIAYALSPNEQLFGYCVSLNTGSTADGVPAVTNSRITISDNTIILNGRTPLREPLMAMTISVNCPYTANLARNYTLMIDPAPPTVGEPVMLSTGEPVLTPLADSTVTASDIPTATRPAPAARRTQRPQNTSPIAAMSRYQVRPGDSLSQIVSRIENRSIALWPAVDAIFAANPEAFLNNDRNLLKAGSWLNIPDMTSLPAAATADSGTQAGQQAPAGPSATVYDGASTGEIPAVTTSNESRLKPLPQVEPVAETAAEPELFTEMLDEPLPVVEPAEPVAEVTVPRLRPGDVVIGTDNPFIVPVGSNDGVIDIPDSELQGPQVSQPVPSVAVINANDGGTSGAWSWLLWLGGAGVALILALLIFGRQIRERFGSVAVGAPATPQRRREDQPDARRSVADIDFNFDADTLTSKTITLDADLEAGTGLDDSAEMDVAQDFGYSATSTDSEMDLEITEHAAREEEHAPTDVIPPQHQGFTDSTVLDEEIMPSDEAEEEEDYDFSMNVDATKHVIEDNMATTKDLQAVMVDTNVIDEDDTSEHTVSKDADYQILEQDYEDELTATQALNKEIEEAARALAEQMDEADAGADTREMPVSQDPEITAELTANLEAPGDAENEEFTDGSIPDLMVDMPISDNDATLDVESVPVEVEKKEAS